MTTKLFEKPVTKLSAEKKLTALILLLTLICVCIFVIRSFPEKESEFVDSVAGQIAQEMADNRIVLSKNGVRRTVAEFQEPIIQTHGKESRLIVHTAELSQQVSLANEGWGGFKWTSTYQDAVFQGIAEYTVDLSQLSEENFMVNNELKILTVKIPYAVLSPINILDDRTQYYDPERGWAGPKAVEMTPEDYSKVMMEVKEKMKAQLIDQNIVAEANEDAKTVVAELLAATIHSVDPEFTVVVVQ